MGQRKSSRKRIEKLKKTTGGKMLRLVFTFAIAVLSAACAAVSFSQAQSPKGALPQRTEHPKGSQLPAAAEADVKRAAAAVTQARAELVAVESRLARARQKAEALAKTPDANARRFQKLAEEKQQELKALAEALRAIMEARERELQAAIAQANAKAATRAKRGAITSNGR